MDLTVLEPFSPVELLISTWTTSDVGCRGQLQSLQGDVSRLDDEVTGLPLAKIQLAIDSERQNTCAESMLSWPQTSAECVETRYRPLWHARRWSVASPALTWRRSFASVAS